MIRLITMAVVAFSLLLNSSYAIWGGSDKIILSCTGQQTGWVHLSNLSESNQRDKDTDVEGLIKERYEDIEFEVEIDKNNNKIRLFPFDPRIVRSSYGHSIFSFFEPLDESTRRSNSFKSTNQFGGVYTGSIHRHTGKIEVKLNHYHSKELENKPSNRCIKNDGQCSDFLSWKEFLFRLNGVCRKTEKLY